MSDDRWLDRVTESLRAPVGHSDDLDRKILEAVRAERDALRSKRFKRIGAIRVGGLVAAAAVVTVVAYSLTSRWSSSRSLGPTAIQFELAEPAAHQVVLVGDFNDWDRSRTPLIRDGDRWRTTVRLPTGVYRYAFLVDGVRWVADPRKPGPADQDFGQPISMLATR
jgi:hypothetical protein